MKPILKLYLIHQNENQDYDSYDSAVVVASSAALAKQIHPSELNMMGSSSWCKPSYVRCKYIGIYKGKLESGSVICASFNAG